MGEQEDKGKAASQSFEELVETDGKKVHHDYMEKKDRMSELHSFKDGKAGCYSNIRMDNGDPCYISVAQTGVIVKKSKIGMFGAKLYEETNVYDAAKNAERLHGLYPDKTPTDMTNPVLKAFTNAALNCRTLAEVTRILNEGA